MLVFDFPWAFAALPLPLMVWWLLPPYREASHAVRVPFFDEAARAAGVTPSHGAVILETNWMQKLFAPVAWGLVVTATANPQWVEPPIERVESARELMLAIDISQSMETCDFVDPQGRRVDRLKAVKGVVDEFIGRRKGDRIGLIVFGASAFPQAPLTLDHKTVQSLLDEVRIGMAGPQTSIGDAIGVAIKMTEHSKTKERVLILLTDGNDTASRLPPKQALRLPSSTASPSIRSASGIPGPAVSSVSISARSRTSLRSPAVAGFGVRTGKVWRESIVPLTRSHRRR